MTAADDWYSNDAATFGDRLAAARDACGLEQKALAQKLGVSRKCLWERRQRLGIPRKRSGGSSQVRKAAARAK